jgi:hypothetical protein
VKKIQTLSFLATLAIVFGMISWGSTLNAQTAPAAPQDQQTPSTQQPSPDTPPAQQPSAQPSPSSPSAPSAQQPPAPQTPSQSSPTSSASDAATAGSDAQVFSGTVEKSGDKFVLKDDSGKTYDIDHQDDVKKFEGKRVRVQGKLDETGKKILVK